MARKRATKDVPRMVGTCPEEQAFLDAIMANPLDQAARQMHADWLSERGVVFGEYIGMYTALQNMQPPLNGFKGCVVCGDNADDKCQYHALADRIAALTEEHQQEIDDYLAKTGYQWW